MKKIIYDWGRGTLQRIEIVTEADLEKKPELPQASGIVKRLKAAVIKRKQSGREF